MRASHTVSVPTSRFSLANKILRICFLISLIAFLLPEGSVRPEPLHLIAVPAFAIVVLAVAFNAPSDRHRWLFGLTMAIVVVLAFWCVAQAAQFGGNPFANPVWPRISEIVGSVPGAISIAPANTIEAMVPVLMPFAVFIAALVLFQSDQDALTLLRFMAISGAFVALYGLIQFEFFPETLLFRKKEFYLHDLTAVLVNRNSIATYLGAALILNAGFLYDSLVTKRSAPVAALNG